MGNMATENMQLLCSLSYPSAPFRGSRWESVKVNLGITAYSVSYSSATTRKDYRGKQFEVNFVYSVIFKICKAPQTTLWTSLKAFGSTFYLCNLSAYFALIDKDGVSGGEVRDYVKL